MSISWRLSPNVYLGNAFGCCLGIADFLSVLTPIKRAVHVVFSKGSLCSYVYVDVQRFKLRYRLWLVSDFLGSSAPHYRLVNKMGSKLKDEVFPVFGIIRFVDCLDEVLFEGRNVEYVNGKFIGLAFCHGMSQSHISFNSLFLHLVVCSSGRKGRFNYGPFVCSTDCDLCL